MSIREYLFVDEKRLNSYVDQIGPPIIYDKVPVWSAEISLKPKVGGTQTRHARSPTQAEKIQLLVSHLRDNHLLNEPRNRLNRGPFVLETHFAVKFLVPRSDSDTNLSLWLAIRDEPNSESEREFGVLCLLEDYQGNDRYNNTGESSFSILMSLLEGLRSDSRNAIILQKLNIPEQMDSSMMITDIMAIPDVGIDFAKNPFDYLQLLGCRPSPRRKIEVLYRVREYGVDDLDQPSWNKISLFGYPIYIAEA